MINNWYIIAIIAIAAGAYAAWQHRIVIADATKKLFGGGKSSGPGKPL